MKSPGVKLVSIRCSNRQQAPDPPLPPVPVMRCHGRIAGRCTTGSGPPHKKIIDLKKVFVTW